MSLGFSMPFMTAFFVISLKTTLSIFLSLSNFFSSRNSFTCHAIASPSRSGSVARIILFESFAALVISFKYFFEKLSTYQIILNLYSESTDPFFDGKSLMCP